LTLAKHGHRRGCRPPRTRWRQGWAPGSTVTVARYPPAPQRIWRRWN